MLFGSEMVAVMVLEPIAPVSFSPGKEATPLEAATVVVPVKVALATLKVTFCDDCAPVVTGLSS